MNLKCSNVDNIPKHRSFNLYIILISGILISLLGILMQLSPNERKPQLYFDGEAFRYGTINGVVFFFVGVIISIFPLYHLNKGSHKKK